MTSPRGPSFRDGMPRWAWGVLALGRLLALLPLALVVALAVWLARGGIHQVPGLLRQAWGWLVALFDTLGGRG